MPTRPAIEPARQESEHVHSQQRTGRVPSHRGESLAVVGVVLLTVLEAVAYLCAPRSAHAFVGGALLGAGSAAGITVAGTFTARRRDTPARRTSAELGTLDVSDTERFPMEAIRPLLLGQDAPSLNRLYLAWAFIREGFPSEWVRRYLDLPSDVTQLLDAQNQATSELLPSRARSRRSR